MEAIVWPKKQRELQDHHSDSTIWNDFQYRDGDVIIATYPKSGTTWMQQIVAQLLTNGKMDNKVVKQSPWLEFRFLTSDKVFGSKEKLLAMMENQTNRRFLKTHLPLDTLVFSPKAKYIFVARDGRDVAFSLYNHQLNLSPEFCNHLNSLPGRIGAPFERIELDFREYFHHWIDTDGAPFKPFFENIRSWWNIRHLPNVLVMHYAQLKSDFPNELERLAQFLDIPVDRSSPEWNNMLEHCSFDYMKKNSNTFIPDEIFEGGATTFFRGGTNNNWKNLLTKEDCERYEEKARSELGEEGARWLATGNQTISL